MRILLLVPLLLAGPSPAPRTPPPAAKKLRVVATIPDLADLVRQIGGKGIEVVSIARGRENVHAVPIKPSHLIATKRADLFLQIGLSLEHSWVPGLLQSARNRALQPGQPGFVNVSAGFPVLDVPAQASRRDAASVHPWGNPHVNLDPRFGRHAAARIESALAALQPDRAGELERNAERYRERLALAEERWQRMADGLQGHKVVVYHVEFDYLLRATGIRIVGTLEPKPGVPPTPAHLARLAAAMRAEGAQVILTAPWSNGGKVAGLAEKTGARVVELPVMVGGARGADTWIELLDLCHARLRAAFGLPEVDPSEKER